jgi:hypothetical protein
MDFDSKELNTIEHALMRAKSMTDVLLKADDLDERAMIALPNEAKGYDALLKKIQD